MSVGAQSIIKQLTAGNMREICLKPSFSFQRSTLARNTRLVGRALQRVFA